MRTAKKRSDGRGGWSTIVTMDDGTELRVELVRESFRRNWFGHASYDWTARIHHSGWGMCQLVGRPGNSAQHLARRALRFWEGTN